MSKLWPIVESIEKLLEAITEAETVQEAQMYERLLNEAENDLTARLNGICSFIRNAENDILVYESEIKRLRDDKTKLENKIEKLKNLLANLIGEGKRWFSGVHKISWRKGESLEIDEAAEPNPAFVRVIEEHDKEAIREHLKSGGTLPYARFVTKNHIQVR